MKRTALITVVLLAVMTTGSYAIDAMGSAFGTLNTAKPAGMGVGQLGGGIGIGDNVTSFYGSFTYGLSDITEFRLKLGMADPDAGDAAIAFGADFSYQMLSFVQGGTAPFDLSVGGLLEYADFDGISVLQAGAFVLGSYPFAMNNGSTLSPYGRINLRMEKYDWDNPGLGDDSETELKFGLNMGVEWQVSRDVGLFGELQLDGNDGLMLGITYNVM